MKLPFLMTIVAASVLFEPAFAQPARQQPTDSHRATSSPAAPDNLMSERDGVAIPSRRTPGLTPPKRDERHPVTPDEAWPKTSDTGKPLPPSMKPGTQGDRAGKIFLNDERTDSEGSIKLQ